MAETSKPQSAPDTSGSEAGNEEGYVSGGTQGGNSNAPTPSDTGRGAEAVQGASEGDQGYAQNPYDGPESTDGPKTAPHGTEQQSGSQDRTTGTGGVAGVSQASGEKGGYESAGTRDEDYDSGKPRGGE